jgi:hypothetical protein
MPDIDFEEIKMRLIIMPIPLRLRVSSIQHAEDLEVIHKLAGRIELGALYLTQSGPRRKRLQADPECQSKSGFAPEISGR